MKFSCVKAIPLYIMGRPNKGERMPTDAGRDGEVADFLRGDPPAVGAVCDAVDLAVRSFRFADPALNKDLAQEALTRIFANLTSGRVRGVPTIETRVHGCRAACRRSAGFSKPIPARRLDRRVEP